MLSPKLKWPQETSCIPSPSSQSAIKGSESESESESESFIDKLRHTVLAI